MDKTASPMSMNEQQAFPLLRHKIQIFTQSQSKINLVMLINLDANLSCRYRLICRHILDAEIGISPAYPENKRQYTYVYDLHHRPSTMPTKYQLLRLPALTSKTRETACQFLNGFNTVKFLPAING
jgi:hypothetical protein